MAAIGSAVALALIMNVLQKNNKRVLSDAHIFAFFQSEILKAKTTIHILGN
jgi:hypothetical protein